MQKTEQQVKYFLVNIWITYAHILKCNLTSQLMPGWQQNFASADTFSRDGYEDHTQSHRDIGTEYTTIATGQGSWRSIRPPTVRPPAGQCSERRSVLWCGQKAPAAIVAEDVERSPANRIKHSTPAQAYNITIAQQLTTAAAARHWP